MDCGKSVDRTRGVHAPAVRTRRLTGRVKDSRGGLGLSEGLSETSLRVGDMVRDSIVPVGEKFRAVGVYG